MVFVLFILFYKVLGSGFRIFFSRKSIIIFIMGIVKGIYVIYLLFYEILVFF